MSKTAEKKLTAEQTAAIEKEGRLIVSASAGSGKTFVMIERLADYIQSGGDLDGVLAVTFTKKAAAQMKEKLRSALIDRARGEVTPEQRAHLKTQLNKIPSANISTIHSFCVYLLRTHFYLVDIDGSFDILSEDNGAEKQLKKRAMDGLFDRLYEEKNDNFMLVLSCYVKKRSDETLRRLVLAAYDGARTYADYRRRLEDTAKNYTPETFAKISGRLADVHRDRCRAARMDFDEFMKGFCIDEKAEAFAKIADEVDENLRTAEARRDIFEPLPKFATTQRPKVKDDSAKEQSKLFGDMRDAAKKVYDKFSDFCDRQAELESFLKSGRLAAAFADIVLQFDSEYAAIKREEGKLDYADLEHITLKLLEDEDVKKEVRSSFKQVFVDEYQDVNPVQEAIISAVGGDNLFLVGDVKQAIYGFRGSKSVYFTKKIEEFSAKDVDAAALSLTSNFRSAPAVIDGVNKLFSALMLKDTCGIDYKKDGVMKSGGAYPEGSGGVTLHIFGGEEENARQDLKVYSVTGVSAKKAELTREGKKVADIIFKELESEIYDLEEKKFRPVRPSDICILTRKNAGDSTAGILRALAQAGLPVSGSQGGNVCDAPECKQIIDILSYIDNGEQDIPMASAMLSPVGGFTEQELVKIRMAGGKDPSFRDCCLHYAENFKDVTAEKLNKFYLEFEEYRRLSKIFGAATLIDKLLADGAMESAYMRGNGVKLKNVRRLAAEAETPSGELFTGPFLEKLKSGGYRVPLTQSGGGDSVKVMTMHSSKGLEFPIVILADVCRQFGGGESENLPLSETYGFVHKTYDVQSRICKKNILNVLQAEESRIEEAKNEMNLLYVACTRAKYRLHILAEEERPFSPYSAVYSNDYAGMLDMSLLEKDATPPPEEEELSEEVALIGKPDEDTLEKLRSHYKIPYRYAESVDLPVKSSASAILKSQEDDYYASRELFPEESEGEGGTGTERGIAYHRYLQLCDFNVKDKDGITAELEKFASDGLITEEQVGLLNVDNLEKILSMNVFSRLGGKKLYREQEFLCSLPANEFLNTDAADNVMVQGVMDLFCEGDGECIIIDYKYSKKGDGAIIKTYAPQLNLYRRAAAKITGVPEEKISAVIVNIYTLREIPIILT
ncbi:MAG: UvrD-helicase domain-containing protein [Clostridia bacterium]|nr:UvrD-helicase domain-containing protein [Clostridia bacterium]